MSGTMPENAHQLDEEIQLELDLYYEQAAPSNDQPLDNLFSAKQQTLLKRPLYASWTPPPGKRQTPGQKRPFLADANIGLFYSLGEPPVAPDFFLSLDAQPRADWHEKKNRSYFVWEFGKVPEVVVEIVSNRDRGEMNHKLDEYERIGVVYYVIYDPQLKLGENPLRVFVLRDGEYQELDHPYLSRLGLGLKLWDGIFEDREDTWLRWCDEHGNVILTGEERARMEAERADYEASARREAEERAAQFAAKLRELGVDPDQL
jgi:Uma2 family endonuclease